MVLPVPRTRDEQDAIVDSIRSRTSTIEAAVARTEREIGLLREYRTRLVADVVTGKLDVRATTRNLPDADESTTSVPDESELIEEEQLA